ncbi:ribonuclease D [Haliangium ochraceum]|uniref:Ribonuclease D n=1 Tax=Haliangium ochraceum (strain DSM 14365 / JCM 11303 / SMP-2) TaxID=502025 RepID=D0LT15_HALO1|nr:HRDC domain-containing protein [Haliangium ochraceum]ACY19151.1 Ribonuclease D [Haliangium ochraceum DSM 14365]
MSESASHPTPLTDAASVAAVAARVAAAGAMAFDFEFASDGRFLAELALVQVSWGDPEAPEIALIDSVAVDPTPVLRLIGDPAVVSVAHAAKQDLGILAARFDIFAENFWDTQIAAAFVGMAEQIGYGKLVDALLGVQLDKASQFTKWLERPLSPAQLRYAADDVRYLPRVWAHLSQRLDELGRRAWVGEESALLARDAMPYGPAELAYHSLKGAGALRGKALGRLAALAAWRQERALADNLPLSWVLPDKALLELSRRGARGPGDVRNAPGVTGTIARRYADAIVSALQGAGKPPAGAPPSRGPSLDDGARLRVPVVMAMLQTRAAEAGIAARFAATRADAESLVAWHAAGGDEGERDGVPLLEGWRRDLFGDAALAWLRGERALRCDPGSGALRLDGES